MRIIFCFAVLVMIMGCSSAMFSEDTGKIDENTIILEAKRFDFSKEALTIKKDERIDLTLKSLDIPGHNFNIDELGVHTSTVGKGKSLTVQFSANKTGTYEYYCAVPGHRLLGMKGNITIE